MKTWKKIEETKKRTADILNLKRRNEEKIQKVMYTHRWLLESHKNVCDGRALKHGNLSFIMYAYNDWLCVFEYCRKFKTCSIRATNRSTRVRTITCCPSRDRMRREKFKKLSSYHVTKKPNRQRLNAQPTNKLACSMLTRCLRRIVWRTKSLISRRLLPKWKYKRKRSVKWLFPSSISSKEWLKRRLLDAKRKKKSCRWSS